MAHFVKTTSVRGGEEVWVNLDRVVEIRHGSDGGSLLVIRGAAGGEEQKSVKETPTELVNPSPKHLTLGGR